MIKISLTGGREAKLRLRPSKSKVALKAGLNRLVLFAVGSIGENARKSVYQNKIGNRYTFTGNLLGGRGNARNSGEPRKDQTGSLEYTIQANPQFKGAKTNYAPFVNKGTSRMKARPFWDNAVKVIKRESGSILKEATVKEFN